MEVRIRSKRRSLCLPSKFFLPSRGKFQRSKRRLWVRTNAYTKDTAKMGYYEANLALKVEKIKDIESRQGAKEKSGGSRLNFPTAIAL